MNDWAEIDMEQALPLLSGFFSLNDVYTHMRGVNPLPDDVKQRYKEIRHFAVETLKSDKVTSEQLELLSLQLVAVLRYEDFSN